MILSLTQDCADSCKKSLVIGSASSDTADAFAEAGCTTLETAKTLTDASPCLQRFPAKQRSAFLQQVAAADITGTWYLANHKIYTRQAHCLVALLFTKLVMLYHLIFCAQANACAQIYLCTLTGPVQPFKNINSMSHFRELPPLISRSLYIILQDQDLRDADPQRVLPPQLYKHKQSRLSNAKLLTHESECLQGVPSQAVDRFLELVALYDIPEGTT
jgi:hypothetical protein